MKVRYISENKRLTIGKEYLVIELLSCTETGVSYRLINDDDQWYPAIFLASEFEIVTDYVPTNWSLTIKQNGLIVNGPKFWRELSFWENFYDQEPKAIEIYKREARKIYEEENAI